MKDAVILVTRFGMGTADKTLQITLLEQYLELILQGGDYPSAICFYADGVKLVCEGSPVLKQLDELEKKSVRLVVCSTCLSYFNLREKIRVGIVGGMGDILEAQTKADKVISI